MNLLTYFKSTCAWPKKYAIPHGCDAYLSENSFLKRVLKFARRYMLMLYYQQESLLQETIEKKHHKILWLNISTPSLGDSLMDVSSRVLLKDHEVTLFCAEKNRHLYEDDIIFKSVYTDYDAIENSDYDLLIIDSFSSRTLKMKHHYFPDIPFVTLYGFNGPDLNRILFSFHRMNALLDSPKTYEEIDNIAQLSLSLSPDDEMFATNLHLPCKYITIAVGGEWAFRTYQHWDEVVDQLYLLYPDLEIVLVGSDNGKVMAEKIVEKHHAVKNYVGKLTFKQSAALIAKSSLFICADGGLMHAAGAFLVPTVGLFAAIDPSWRVVKKNTMVSLYHDRAVSQIAVRDIVKSVEECDV